MHISFVQNAIDILRGKTKLEVIKIKKIEQNIKNYLILKDKSLDI